MLQGCKIEFKLVNNREDYLSEGTLIAETGKYKCIAAGENFFVGFTNCFNQIMIISEVFNNNLDPDGGTTFMENEVRALIESLASKKIYVQGKEE